MPPGIPVATVAINGAKNAAILAVSILGLVNSEINSKLVTYKLKMEKESMAKNEKLK